MLSLWDILIIVVLFFVMQILFIRLIMFGLKRIAPQLGGQLMGGAAQNIPNIPIQKALGFGLYQFFAQGGIHILLEKVFGIKPPPPGGNA